MKYVIIGNSAAAIGTIQGIRQVDKEGQIVVIADEKYHTYSRPLISYWLKGAVTKENMRYRDEDFYEKNDVDTLFGTRVTKINPAAKTVTIENGNEISYDKLMIATGSKPFIPPMEGLDKVAKKFTFISFSTSNITHPATGYKTFTSFEFYLKYFCDRQNFHVTIEISHCIDSKRCSILSKRVSTLSNFVFMRSSIRIFIVLCCGIH